MSLRTKYLLLMLVVILPVFLLLVCLIFFEYKTVVETIEIKRLDTLADIQKARVLDLLQGYNQRLTLLTHNALLQQTFDVHGGNNNQTIESITALLQGIKQSTTDIADLSIVSPDGVTIASTTVAPSGTVFSAMDVVQIGKEKTGPVRLFKTATDEIFLYVAGPITRAHAVQAVVIMQIKAEALFNLFHGYATLGETGDWGMSMPSSNSEGVVVVPSKYETRPEARLGATFSLDSKLPAALALSGFEGTSQNTVDFRGKKVLTATRFIPGLQWGIVAKIDQDEAFSPVRVFLLSLTLITSGVLLLFLCIALVVTSRMVRPIQQIASTVEKIAHGDLSARVSGIDNTDEIGRLANSVNVMARKLEESQATLEEKIQSRTRDLEDAKQFLNSVIENLPLMVFVKDAKNLRFTHFNKAGEKLLGYSKAEILGKNDYDFFPKQQADFFTKKDREVLANVAGVDIPEESIDTKSNGKRLLHTRKTALRSRDGKPVYLLGISEDITNRKKIDQQITEDKAIDEAILASIGDGLVVVDTTGRVTRVNSAFEKMLGWKESEVLGKLFTEIVHTTDERGEEIPSSERPINIMLKERVKTNTTTTTNFRRKDTTSFVGVITTSPIFVGSDFVGVVEVFRDVTQEKARAIELEEQKNELERFNKLMVDRELKMIELKEQSQQRPPV